MKEIDSKEKCYFPKVEKIISACLKGYYGQHCASACRCPNQKPCNHITGRCHCPNGYTGHLCTELCPLGTFGENCAQQCECAPNANCDPITGKCFCKPGYAGVDCAQDKFHNFCHFFFSLYKFLSFT